MLTGKIDLDDLDTSISEFLAWESMSRDTIDVKRVYCDIAGDLVSGVLLSQIIYWHLPNKNGDSRLSVDRADHLWLAKSYPDWWEECRVTEKQARRAIRVMAGRGIILVGKWQFNGAPTTHIRLNWTVFLKSLAEVTAVAKEKAVSKFRSAQKADRSAQKADRSAQRAKRSAQKGGSLTENTSENTSETTTEITSEVNSKIDFKIGVDDDDDESRQHDSSSSIPTNQKTKHKRASKPTKALIKAIATWTDLSQRSKKVTEAAVIVHNEGLGNERTVEDWIQRSWPDERPSNATRRRPWPSQVVDGLQRRKEIEVQLGFGNLTDPGDVCAGCGAIVYPEEKICSECGRELEALIDET